MNYTLTILLELREMIQKQHIASKNIYESGYREGLNQAMTIVDSYIEWEQQTNTEDKII
ncbi:MAG: hypothetical protein KBC56_10135 [Flavobacterium sp.]|nr:hypothetical protein [Flavobacterium sp.]